MLEWNLVTVFKTGPEQLFQSAAYCLEPAWRSRSLAFFAANNWLWLIDKTMQETQNHGILSHLKPKRIEQLMISNVSLFVWGRKWGTAVCTWGSWNTRHGIHAICSTMLVGHGWAIIHTLMVEFNCMFRTLNLYHRRMRVHLNNSKQNPEISKSDVPTILRVFDLNVSMSTWILTIVASLVASGKADLDRSLLSRRYRRSRLYLRIFAGLCGQRGTAVATKHSDYLKDPRVISKYLEHTIHRNYWSFSVEFWDILIHIIYIALFNRRLGDEEPNRYPAGIVGGLGRDPWLFACFCHGKLEQSLNGGRV